MNPLSFLSRREARPVPAEVTTAEPVTRLTKADLPPRRFDESAADLAGRGAAVSRPRRRFFGAASSASYLSWDVPNVSVDHALYFNLERMRARVRDLARNNDYARHFLRLLESNVVGPKGFTLQGRRYAGKTLDRPFNLQLEYHWKKAGKLKNAPTTCRKMSKRELAALWLRTMATDGEVFEVFYPAHGNRYRFASRIIDASLVDWTKNELLPNGNRIKMGVEVDEHDAPVAYWVLTRNPSDYLFASPNTAKEHQRFTADRARLTFLQEFPGQTRGISWLAAPAVRAQMLQKFEEAVVIASRGAAAKGGFYEVSEDYQGALPGESDEDYEPGEMVRKSVEPGEWELLPRGVKAVPYDPQAPPTGVDALTASMLRGIASGMGGPYVHIANNLEGVNYSSIRAGDLEQRGIYRALQQFVIDHHEEPYFCEWAKILRMNPATPIDGRKLDACLDGDEYRFLGRGWDWVDPQKEVLAHEKAIQLGLTTRGRVIAERTGEDIEDVLDDLQLENEMMIERGLEPRIGVVVQTSDKQTAGKTPPNGDKEDADEDE
jgi:lambda family phage portal protein